MEFSASKQLNLTSGENDNNFTSYNIDGQIIDTFIYIGQGVSSYTTPMTISWK